MNKIGSSETIRKTTFNFYDYKKNMVSHKKAIKKHFLEWFIGFSEGNGSFIVSNNRLFFIINQKQQKILHIIRCNLGFGKVSTYNTYSRFIVADKTNIERLIFLFNGNLLLNKTNNCFNLWLNARNCYSEHEIKCLNKNKNFEKITVKFLENKQFCFENNAWLSGFIDAEGCFNAIKISDKKYFLPYTVRLRFIIDQKSEEWLFYKLKQFLHSGVISSRKKVQHMFRFTSTSISSHEKLIQYLNNYPLRTFKKVSFVRFTFLLYYIKKRHILPWEKKILKKVENLIKNIK